MSLIVDLDRLQKQRIFVGGGAGFIGSALTRKLLQHGAEVLVYDNLLHGCEANLQGVRAELVVGDACDEGALFATMRQFQPSLVVSCIGDTFVTTAYAEPGRFFRNNLEATHSLLRCARQLTLDRFLYLSTTEVYGPHGDTAIDENAGLNPVNTYAVSKLAADRLCAKFSAETDCPVLIARIFNCYGPRETHAYVIPEIIEQLHKGDIVRLGNLHAARDFTYVDDTVEALAALLLCDAKPGTVVNVGTGSHCTVTNLVCELAAIMRPAGVQVYGNDRLRREHDIDLFLCNPGRLHALTGWLPKVKRQQGLQRTVDWYLSHQAQWPWKHSAAERAVHLELAKQDHSAIGLSRATSN